MARKDVSYSSISIVLFLLGGIFFAGFIFLADYVGIPLRGVNDEDINEESYVLFFGIANLVLAWRVVYFIFLKKVDGEWTRKQKAMWRYWFVGALLMGFIFMTIEHLKLPELLELLLECGIGLGIPFFLYINYRIKYKYKLFE